MSTTDVLDVPHIVEAMEQILLTRPYERKWSIILNLT